MGGGGTKSPGKEYTWMNDVQQFFHVLYLIFIVVIWAFVIAFVFEGAGLNSVNQPKTIRWLLLAAAIAALLLIFIALYMWSLKKWGKSPMKIFTIVYAVFLIFLTIVTVWVFTWQDKRASLFTDKIPIFPNSGDGNFQLKAQAWHLYNNMMIYVLFLNGLFFMGGVLIFFMMRMKTNGKPPTSTTDPGETTKTETRNRNRSKPTPETYI